MTFDELLVQVRELVQSKGRVAYRALKRRFALDDEYLEDLKAELIEAERVACDEDGKVLVWLGEGETAKRGNGEKEDKGLGSSVRLGSKDQSPTPSTQSLAWFTEGFDTKDLQEAKALLEELSV